MKFLCQICKKHISYGNNVPFSHKKTKRIWKPNLQRTKNTFNFKQNKAKYFICAKCIKKTAQIY